MVKGTKATSPGAHTWGAVEQQSLPRGHDPGEQLRILQRADADQPRTRCKYQKLL